MHVLPEKIAHKRHHPQTEAIQVLCLLSLVFGGMLWPLAWLWAYTQARALQDGVRHGQARATTLPTRRAHEGARPRVMREDVARLRAELDRLMAQGGAPGGAGGDP